MAANTNDWHGRYGRPPRSAGSVEKDRERATHGRPTTSCLAQWLGKRPGIFRGYWVRIVHATLGALRNCGESRARPSRSDGGGEHTGSGVKVVKACDRAPDSHAPFSACGSHDLMLHKDDRTGALQATSRRRSINVTLTPSFSSEIAPQTRTLSNRYIRKTHCAAIRFGHDLRLVWHFFHRTS